MAIGIGLDVGGTKVLGIALTDEGANLAEVRLASPHNRAELLDVIEAAIEALLASLGPAVAGVVGAGAGFPGLVEQGRGALHAVPNLSAAEGFTVRDDLQPRLDRLAVRYGLAALPLSMDNDATCAAAGEWAFGVARGCREAVVVTIGTGIGGGLITGGRVLRGARGFAGEVGHMVIDVDGPVCGCGSRGCWEQWASGSGLARIARQEAGDGRLPGLLALAGSLEAVKGEHVLELARQGDQGARAVFALVGRYLAIGLSNLAEIFDPDMLILSGGLVRAGDQLVRPALEAFARYSNRSSGVGAVPVVVAELGDRAGAVGAATIGMGLAG